MYNSGNCVVDRHEREDRKMYKCTACNGTGKIPWDSFAEGMEKMMDDLAYVAYKRKKQGNPITKFSEMLRVARIVKARGCDCPDCDGLGEI